MQTLSTPHIVVIGATGGIEKVLSQRLQAHGARLTLGVDGGRSGTKLPR